MPPPLYFTLDLLETGLLPAGWDRPIAALADAPERATIIPDPYAPDDEGWSFATVAGDTLRDRCPWLLALYLGPLRDFAARCLGRAVYLEQRLRSAISLHILSGAGARLDWHTHGTMTNGLLFVTSADASGGGDLVFRGGDGREERLAARAGTFVCFDGAVEHCVAPLRSAMPRLTVPLIYFNDPADQCPAYGADLYF